MSAVMLSKTERRQNNQNLVLQLQKERQQVWSLYCKVAELKPFSCSSNTQSILTQFSQLLIDYVSLGHFGLFDRVISGNERRAAILSAAKNLYPEFSKTTEDVISFNDRYDDNAHPLNVDTLEADLSLLGESLAKRVDLEDRLCQLAIV
jgi:regulator of sigma D